MISYDECRTIFLQKVKYSRQKAFVKIKEFLHNKNYLKFYGLSRKLKILFLHVRRDLIIEVYKGYVIYWPVGQIENFCIHFVWNRLIFDVNEVKFFMKDITVRDKFSKEQVQM